MFDVGLPQQNIKTEHKQNKISAEYETKCLEHNTEKVPFQLPAVKP